MKLSDYGTLVSSQEYLFTRDKVLNMYYESMDETKIKVEMTLNTDESKKDKFYKIEMSVNDEIKTFNSVKSYQLIQLMRLFKVSENKSLSARRINYNNAKKKIGDTFIVSLPLRNKSIDFEFSLSETDSAVVTEDNSCDMFDKDKNPLSHIDLTKNGVFSTNFTDKVSMSSYNFLDNRTSRVDYFNFLKCKNSYMENIIPLSFLPEKMIVYTNDEKVSEIELSYDEFGILIDKGELPIRYERFYWDDADSEDEMELMEIVSCHPDYIDGFNPDFYYSEDNEYYVIERLDLSDPIMFTYNRDVYKIDKDKLEELKLILSKESKYPILGM